MTAALGADFRSSQYLFVPSSFLRPRLLVAPITFPGPFLANVSLFWAAGSFARQLPPARVYFNFVFRQGDVSSVHFFTRVFFFSCSWLFPPFRCSCHWSLVCSCVCFCSAFASATARALLIVPAFALAFTPGPPHAAAPASVSVSASVPVVVFVFAYVFAAVFVVVHVVATASVPMFVFMFCSLLKHHLCIYMLFICIFNACIALCIYTCIMHLHCVFPSGEAHALSRGVQRAFERQGTSSQTTWHVPIQTA